MMWVSFFSNVVTSLGLVTIMVTLYYFPRRTFAIMVEHDVDIYKRLMMVLNEVVLLMEDDMQREPEMEDTLGVHHAEMVKSARFARLRFALAAEHYRGDDRRMSFARFSAYTRKIRKLEKEVG
jgi:hypothetical protein